MFTAKTRKPFAFFLRILACLLAAALLPAGVLSAAPARAEVYIDQEKPADWEERKLLRITALYALDCDSFVVECGGKTMLIDGGNKPKEDDLVAFLEERNMTHLDVIFVSHPHDDHIEAVYNALMHDRITADVFISPFRPDYIAYDKLEFHKKTVRVLEEKGIPFRQMADGEELDLGGARVVLYRFEGSTKKPDGGSMTLNDMSGVLYITYGDSAILLTADIGGMIQKMLAEKFGPEGLRAEILKAPHHGKNAVNGDLLKAVDPKLTIITGKVARTEDCRKQMETAGIEWKRTSYGQIVMESDGTDWYVNQEDKFGELEKLRRQKERQKKKKK